MRVILTIAVKIKSMFWVCNDMKAEEENASSQYRFHRAVGKHRFCIAIAIVSGLLFLLFTSIITRYPDPLLMSGLFSGWMTAIIGFYFLNETALRIAGQLMETEQQRDQVKFIASYGPQELAETKQLFNTKELEKGIMDRNSVINALVSDLEEHKEGVPECPVAEGGKDDNEM